jgi:hypothetical protein
VEHNLNVVSDWSDTNTVLAFRHGIVGEITALFKHRQP